jgi:hypothetical protein
MRKPQTITNISRERTITRMSAKDAIDLGTQDQLISDDPDVDELIMHSS